MLLSFRGSCRRNWSARPVPFQLVVLGGEGIAAFLKWPKARTCNRAEVGKPSAQVIGLHMAATRDGQRSQSGQVNCLCVETPDPAARINDELTGTSIIEMWGSYDPPPRLIDQHTIEGTLAS